MTNTKPRLRLTEINQRSMSAVRAHERRDTQRKAEREAHSIVSESAATQQNFSERMSSAHDAFGTSLLRLFNFERVEYVRKVNGSETFSAVFTPKNATHELVPTSWNKNGEYDLPKSFALSVCAVPLKPKIRPTNIEVRKRVPKRAPVYNAQSSTRAKRVVLCFLVKAMRANVTKKTILRMCDSECDLLHSALHRASQLLRLRQLLELESV